jgi:hypothetical protein
LRSKVKVPRRSLRYATHRIMVMHPHTKYHWPISRQTWYGPDKKILFKKQLFDLEVKDQGPTKVITVRDTPPYGHAHTNYLPINSLVCWIYLKLFDLEDKGQGPTKVITVRDIPPYSHAPTYEISLTYLERQKSYGLDNLRWEEAEEKIRLKQYVSLRSKLRHNNTWKKCLVVTIYLYPL